MIQKFILLYLLFISLGLIATMNIAASAHEGVQSNSDSIMTWTKTFERHVKKGCGR